MTLNDGVFSLWNGQQATKLLPCFFKETWLSMNSTMSVRFSTSSINGRGIIPLMLYAFYFIDITLPHYNSFYVARVELSVTRDFIILELMRYLAPTSILKN